MAKRTIHMLIDDIDGSSVADESITFSLDGTEYEIDLTNANAKKLREALRPFAEAGTRLGRANRIPVQHRAATYRRTELTPSGATSKEVNRQIREWAAGHGMHVPARGRIKQEVTQAWVGRNSQDAGALLAAARHALGVEEPKPAVVAPVFAEPPSPERVNGAAPRQRGKKAAAGKK